MLVRWRAGLLLDRSWFSLATDFDISDWHGNKLVPDAQESPNRQNNGGYGCVIEVNQHIFNLTDGGIPLIDFGANNLACPSGPRQGPLVDSGYWRSDLGISGLRASMHGGESEKRCKNRDREFHSKLPYVARGTLDMTV
jgi:hypothetical protein